jgi:2-haloacid dehalogenase
MKYWFRKLLHSSVVVGSLDKYTSFSDLARVELENLFYENSKEINESIKNDILGTFTDLRAYEDVITSLNLLKENKIKIIIISNSSKEMMNLQLKNSGIISLIEIITLLIWLKNINHLI